jgi:MtN3 and saliva related transmembrane protein
VQPADWLGWSASLVLLATLARQIQVQWQERSTHGVSGWLFRGQIVASAGFIVYSWLLGNWVFVVTNLALLLTAIAGNLVQRRNRALDSAASGSV